MAESIKFDRAVEFYDQTRGFPPGIEKQAAALLARVGGLSKASRSLEIGVGTGRIALPMSEHVGVIIGVDLSRPMMDKLLEKQRGERIALAEADASRLPFPAAAFDGAVAVHVFHLIPTWREVLAELARVLRPGAPLVVARNADRTDSIGDELRRRGMPGRLPNVGIQEEEYDTFLVDAGWRRQGEAEDISWEEPFRPAELLERVRSRSNSGTWRMSDDELARYVEAVRDILAERYPDLDAEYMRAHRFKAEAYLPRE